MKILIIVSITILSPFISAAENPSVPGSSYTGTNDPKIFRMLIFSCFQNCNEKYWESMYVKELDPASLPKGAVVPALPTLTGRPLVTLVQVQDTHANPRYLYPGLKDGAELLHFRGELPKEGGSQLSFTFTAALVDGSYYLLRPIYINNKGAQDGGGRPAAQSRQAKE